MKMSKIANQIVLGIIMAAGVSAAYSQTNTSNKPNQTQKTTASAKPDSAAMATMKRHMAEYDAQMDAIRKSDAAKMDLEMKEMIKKHRESAQKAKAENGGLKAKAMTKPDSIDAKKVSK
jgi:hypothetical protein